MRELLLKGMESHEQYGVQLNLWDEVINAISVSKELSFLYVCSFDGQKSDAKDLFNAFNNSKGKVHIILDKFLNSFISRGYDHNFSSNIETQNQAQVSQENTVPYKWSPKSTSDGELIDDEPTNCPTEKPRHRSRSRSQEYMASSDNKLRPDTTIKYPPETKFQSQSRNYRSPSNARIPTQTRNVSFASPNSQIPIQCEVKKRSRSKSQDRREYNSRSMYPPVKKHWSQSSYSNRSPPNNRIQTQRGRRSRSRSRSYNEHQYDSRRTKSTKKREPRIRNRSKSRSPDRKKYVTKHQYSSTSKKKDSSSSHQKPKRPSKNIKNSKSSQITETTSSSGTSQFGEEPPTPVDNSNTMMTPQQNAYHVPFYQNPPNAPAMFYPPPQCMPRLIAPPYFMPPRPRLPYPSAYPRVIYRPRWQPEA